MSVIWLSGQDGLAPDFSAAAWNRLLKWQLAASFGRTDLDLEVQKRLREQRRQEFFSRLLPSINPSAGLATIDQQVDDNVLNVNDAVGRVAKQRLHDELEREFGKCLGTVDAEVLADHRTELFWTRHRPESFYETLSSEGEAKWHVSSQYVLRFAFKMASRFSKRRAKLQDSNKNEIPLSSPVPIGVYDVLEILTDLERGCLIERELRHNSNLTASDYPGFLALGVDTFGAEAFSDNRLQQEVRAMSVKLKAWYRQRG